MQVEHDDQVYRCPNVKDQHERMRIRLNREPIAASANKAIIVFRAMLSLPCVRSLPNNKTFSPRDYFNDPPPAYKKRRRNRPGIPRPDDGEGMALIFCVPLRSAESPHR